ncbi:MAG: hypothetical protein LBT53_06500 [Puniceicoccales bacterium]|jgi:hypothetical protein|nr:hypothetical protein [Puniceicoccales bacterium]
MKKSFSQYLLKPALAGIAAVAALFAGCGKNNAPNGELNTLGIPKESVGVVHVNVHAARDTQSGKALFDLIEQRSGGSDKKDFAEIKAATGFNYETDIASITFGAWFDVQQLPVVVTIVRGKFDVAKINAYIEKKIGVDKKNETSIEIGKNKFFRKGGQAFGIVDAQTAIVVQDNSGFKSTSSSTKPAVIEKVLAALDSAEKSYVAPPSLYALGKSVKTPLLLVFADIENTALKAFIETNAGEQGKEFRPQNARIAIGENDGKLALRAVAEYDTKENAAGVNALALLGIAGLRGEIKKQAPPSVGKIFNTLKIKAEDKNFVIEADFPAEDFKNVLKEGAVFK